MAVGDIWQVTNEFIYQENPNQYNWYYEIEDQANADQVRGDMVGKGEAIENALLPLHNTFCNFRCVVARQVFPTFSVPELKKTGNSGVRSCTPIGNVLPGQCSAVVTLYGDREDPTNYNRGRDFWTGQCCEDQVNGTWTNGDAGYLTELCDFYVALGNTFENGGNKYRLGIFSPSRANPGNDPQGDPLPPVVPYFWILEAVRGRSLCRTQRRRQPQDPCEEVCDALVPAIGA